MKFKKINIMPKKDYSLSFRREHKLISTTSDIPKADKYSSIYYTEVADALDISINDVVKMPFHTARYFYYQITRTMLNWSENKYQEGLKRSRKYIIEKFC